MMNPAPASNSAATKHPVRKRSRRRWIIIGLLVAVVVVAAVIAAKRGKRDDGMPVTTEKAVVKTITQLVTATGKVQPEIEVKISPEIGGEIIAIPFKEGAAVKKGDVLVKIKPDYYQALVEQQEAALAGTRAVAVQMKAQLLKAHLDFERNKDLHQKKLISDSDFIVAQTALDVAQANADNAQAQIRSSEGSLKQMRDQLSKTTIYAPVDGTVSSLTSEVGERVIGGGQFAGTEIMRVADLNNMEVRANVNENDVVNVKIDDRARITIDAYPGRQFTGRVKEIASTATTQGANTQEEVTNFEVKIRIAEKDVAFRPGMSANVDIETKTVENAVAVPIQSVTVRSREGNKTIDELGAERDRKAKETQGDGAATAVNERRQRERERADRAALQRVVFVRHGDTVKMTPVETGIGDTTHMEITSGLKEGDEVVSGPFSAITRGLKDGAKIRVNEPKPGKDASKK